MDEKVEIKRRDDEGARLLEEMMSDKPKRKFARVPCPCCRTPIITTTEVGKEIICPQCAEKFTRHD